MPLFDFRCVDCAHEVELLVRFGEVPACPQCGSSRMDKRLGRPTAHVRGGQSVNGSLPLCEPAQTSAPFCGRGLCGMPGCGDN